VVVEVEVGVEWVIGQAKCTWTSANDRDVPAKKINTSPSGSRFLVHFCCGSSRRLQEVPKNPGSIFIGNEFCLANQFLSSKSKATSIKRDSFCTEKNI